MEISAYPQNDHYIKRSGVYKLRGTLREFDIILHSILIAQSRRLTDLLNYISNIQEVDQVQLIRALHLLAHNLRQGVQCCISNLSATVHEVEQLAHHHLVDNKGDVDPANPTSDHAQCHLYKLVALPLVLVQNLLPRGNQLGHIPLTEPILDVRITCKLFVGPGEDGICNLIVNTGSRPDEELDTLGMVPGSAKGGFSQRNKIVEEAVPTRSVLADEHRSQGLRELVLDSRTVCRSRTWAVCLPDVVVQHLLDVELGFIVACVNPAGNRGKYDIEADETNGFIGPRFAHEQCQTGLPSVLRCAHFLDVGQGLL